MFVARVAGWLVKEWGEKAGVFLPLLSAELRLCLYFFLSSETVSAKHQPADRIR